VLEARCVPSLTPADGGLLVCDPDAVDVTARAVPGKKGHCWLANANLAATTTLSVQGVNRDGSMTWETAVNWVAALNAYDNGAGYLGYHNWSLPGTLPKDPPCTLTGPPPNKDSFGYDCAASPMGHLFYTEFGGRPGDTLATLPNKGDAALFENFQPYYYWSVTWEPTRTLPADFSFGSGFLGTDKDIDFEYVLPEFSYPASGQPDPSDLPNPLPDNHPNADDLVHRPNPAPPPPLTVNSDGTIHDGASGVNWLPDADLALAKKLGGQGLTFGLPQGINPNPYDSTLVNINPDGSMSADTAAAWVAAMNRANYLGHTNWRLPASPGVQKQGYYQTEAEMGQLFYSELGGQAGRTIQLEHGPYYPLFHHVQPYYYWSGTLVGDKTESHKSFSFGTGYRSDNTPTNFMYVIPVYDSPPTQTSQRDPAVETTGRTSFGSSEFAWTLGIELAPDPTGATADSNRTGNAYGAGRLAATPAPLPAWVNRGKDADPPLLTHGAASPAMTPEEIWNSEWFDRPQGAFPPDLFPSAVR
jgi:hypothetical protein